MRRMLYFMVLLMLTACAGKPTEMAKNAEEAYKKGLNIVEMGEYSRAAMFLDKFSAKYPYSKYTTPAELLRLKAAYLDEQYILSETLGSRFVSAHPEHNDRVYAQYLVAMSYYKQSYSAKLDQQFSHRARDAFLQLNDAFPVNPYTEDIQKYLSILTNRVAEHELLVGKFYFDRKLYVAAINRFSKVKNNYQNADVSAEALYYLAMSYVSLQETKYAEEVIVLLHDKFPDSAWYLKSNPVM